MWRLRRRRQTEKEKVFPNGERRCQAQPPVSLSDGVAIFFFFVSSSSSSSPYFCVFVFFFFWGGGVNFFCFDRFLWRGKSPKKPQTATATSTIVLSFFLSHSPSKSISPKFSKKKKKDRDQLSRVRPAIVFLIISWPLGSNEHALFLVISTGFRLVLAKWLRPFDCCFICFHWSSLRLCWEPLSCHFFFSRPNDCLHLQQNRQTKRANRKETRPTQPFCFGGFSSAKFPKRVLQIVRQNRQECPNNRPFNGHKLEAKRGQKNNSPESRRIIRVGTSTGAVVDWFSSLRKRNNKQNSDPKRIRCEVGGGPKGRRVRRVREAPTNWAASDRAAPPVAFGTAVAMTSLALGRERAALAPPHSRSLIGRLRRLVHSSLFDLRRPDSSIHFIVMESVQVNGIARFDGSLRHDFFLRLGQLFIDDKWQQVACSSCCRAFQWFLGRGLTWNSLQVFQINLELNRWLVPQSKIKKAINRFSFTCRFLFDMQMGLWISVATLRHSLLFFFFHEIQTDVTSGFSLLPAKSDGSINSVSFWNWNYGHRPNAVTGFLPGFLCCSSVVSKVFLTRHLLRRWKRIKLRQTEGKKTTNEWKLGAKKKPFAKRVETTVPTRNFSLNLHKNRQKNNRSAHWRRVAIKCHRKRKLPTTNEFDFVWNHRPILSPSIAGRILSKFTLICLSITCVLRNQVASFANIRGHLVKH